MGNKFTKKEKRTTNPYTHLITIVSKSVCAARLPNESCKDVRSFSGNDATKRSHRAAKVIHNSI